MDLAILRITYGLLVLYNAIFFLGKFFMKDTFFGTMYQFTDKYFFYFSLLEFLAVAAIFVDLIAGYDKKPLARRRISLFVGALLVMAFIVKLFLNWFHSGFLVD